MSAKKVPIFTAQPVSSSVNTGRSVNSVSDYKSNDPHLHGSASLTWRRDSPVLHSTSTTPLDTLFTPPQLYTHHNIQIQDSIVETRPATSLSLEQQLSGLHSQKTSSQIQSSIVDDFESPESAIWEEYPTYYLSRNKQCSPIWSRKRIGRITMSMIAAITGRNPKPSDPDELTKIIIGISKKSFTLSEETMAQHGIATEPIIRDWYSKALNRRIEEVGLAVWKKDLRFGGSLDGDIYDIPVGTENIQHNSSAINRDSLESVCDELKHVTITHTHPTPVSEEGLEIKAPNKMYKQLIHHIEAIKRGFKPLPGYHEHIFNSHYDQLTGNGVITNKKYMHFVVVSTSENLSYCERLPVNLDHWENTLYPLGCLFYDQYVAPAMRKAGIQRIDPLGSDD
jgi:hypothetical protein